MKIVSPPEADFCLNFLLFASPSHFGPCVPPPLTCRQVPKALLQTLLIFRDTQAAKDELEKGREELQDMMERLRESKDMEAEERQRLEDEIRSKHEEVQVIQNQVPNNFFHTSI